ncbi:hypothetical protein J6590_084966 [Homalodisca vitripennis]|nr:hypothetical protein J6590_084966 [Homalodisca vitripennis]
MCRVCISVSGAASCRIGLITLREDRGSGVMSRSQVRRRANVDTANYVRIN